MVIICTEGQRSKFRRVTHMHKQIHECVVPERPDLQQPSREFSSSSLDSQRSLLFRRPYFWLLHAMMPCSPSSFCQQTSWVNVWTRVLIRGADCQTERARHQIYALLRNIEKIFWWFYFHAWVICSRYSGCIRHPASQRSGFTALMNYSATRGGPNETFTAQGNAGFFLFFTILHFM